MLNASETAFLPLYQQTARIASVLFSRLSTCQACSTPLVFLQHGSRTIVKYSKPTTRHLRGENRGVLRVGTFPGAGSQGVVSVATSAFRVRVAEEVSGVGVPSGTCTVLRMDAEMGCVLPKGTNLSGAISYWRDAVLATMTKRY